jgi:hypothetical protein
MQITQAQLKSFTTGVAAWICDNAVVVTSKKGNDYIAVPNFATAQVDGFQGQVKFAFTAIAPVSESRERATSSAASAIERLSPEERKALLAKYAAAE